MTAVREKITIPVPGWHAWEGVDGCYHARRPRTSPPIGVRARDLDELAERAAEAEAQRAEGTFWPRLLAARSEAIGEMDFRAAQQERWDRMRGL
jgi:hypothetical protein